jgi:hypothetical protein
VAQIDEITVIRCKSFCFVGGNWTIKWAAKQVKEIYLTKEKGSLEKEEPVNPRPIGVP